MYVSRVVPVSRAFPEIISELGLLLNIFEELHKALWFEKLPCSKKTNLKGIVLLNPYLRNNGMRRQLYEFYRRYTERQIISGISVIYSKMQLINL